MSFDTQVEQSSASKADDTTRQTSSSWGIDTTCFLERVVPWPVDDEAPGYVNIHYMVEKAQGTFLHGRPYKNIEAAVGGLAKLVQLIGWRPPSSRRALTPEEICAVAERYLGVSRDALH